MRHLSLFAGIGGFDLAADRAGMTTVGQVEIDPWCRQVLAEHWPDVPRWDDIREVHGGRLPGADIITGGFPCQDISVAGCRAGLDGSRSGLWFEFARILAENDASWCVIENVPGLLSSNGGRDLATILGALGDCGFRYAWRVLDAQWFGVAQRRRRVFIVGHRGAGAGPVEVLFESESVCGDSPPSRRKRPGTTQALRAGTYGGGGPDDNKAQGGFLIAAPLTAGTAATPGVNPPGRRQEDDTNLVITNPLTARMSKGINTTVDEGQTPIVAGSQVRRLMPVECERLQGFSDNWTEGCSDTQRYRQLGNAVAVPVAEWVMRRIMKVDVVCNQTGNPGRPVP